MPHIAVLGKIRGTDYFMNINRFGQEAEDQANLLIVRFDGQLFFGNKDYFRTQLRKQIVHKGNALKGIILNAEAINYIDSSAVFMLKALVQELGREGFRFMLAGAIGPTRDILFSSGLIDEIGEDNLFVKTKEAYQHFQEAVQNTEIQRKIATQSASRHTGQLP